MFLSTTSEERGLMGAEHDNDNSDGWFYRSGHYEFVKKGVPAVVLMEGKDLVDPGRPNKYPRADWYHKPSDEYRDDWDVSGAIANIMGL